VNPTLPIFSTVNSTDRFPEIASAAVAAPASTMSPAFRRSPRSVNQIYRLSNNSHVRILVVRRSRDVPAGDIAEGRLGNRGHHGSSSSRN
jgi:hypothetical protein